MIGVLLLANVLFFRSLKVHKQSSAAGALANWVGFNVVAVVVAFMLILLVFGLDWSNYQF